MLPDSREGLAAVLTKTEFHGHLIVRAANLFLPKHFPWDDWSVVGLIPNDKDAYVQRIAERNETNPDRGEQNELVYLANIRDFCRHNLHRLGALIDPLAHGDPNEFAKHILVELNLWMD